MRRRDFEREIEFSILAGDFAETGVSRPCACALGNDAFGVRRPQEVFEEIRQARRQAVGVCRATGAEAFIYFKSEMPSKPSRCAFERRDDIVASPFCRFKRRGIY